MTGALAGSSLGAEVEVVAKARRRRFTAAHERRVLQDADRCRKPREVASACVQVLVALSLWGTHPALGQERPDVRAALSRADTARAIELLTAQETLSPESDCLLGALLTTRATSGDASWRVRAAAAAAFDRGLRRQPSAECYLWYAELKEKQGARMDADRMLGRALAFLESADEELRPSLRAEIAYRRARLLDAWIRNFEYLVNAPDLAVSTPSCVYSGYFCQNFTRPFDFNSRLAAAPSLAGVVGDSRRNLVAVLDSALHWNSNHLSARRLRLRRALVEDDWDGFDRIARGAVEADSNAVFAWMVWVAARVNGREYDAASRALARIDELIPDTLKTHFERLELVTRNRTVSDPEALWTLSDPFYITPVHERRIQHYARIALADIMFTDPASGVQGRDTPPGRLIIRYGWPTRIWEVPRDGSQELDPESMRAVFEVLACAGTGGAACAIAAERNLPRAGRTHFGRWTFMNYDLEMPSFVFERVLSGQTYRHKLATLSQHLDSAMARRLPSTFDSPYESGEIRSLITRFPRPDRPVVEVSAEFSWPESRGASEAIKVGAFVHERVDGQLVNRAVSNRQASSPASFAGPVAVIWGPLQLSVEGEVARRALVTSSRQELQMIPPNGLGISDLLLGFAPAEGIEAPERRADVRMRTRADSSIVPGAELGVYWETYGLQIAADSSTHYEVTVEVADVAGGRTPGAEVLRFFGRLIDGRDETTVSWTRQRMLRRAYAADVITVRVPEGAGRYSVTVRVRDLVANMVVEVSRIIEVSGTND